MATTWFANPIDYTPSASEWGDGTWTDVDVSSDVPSGATGVIVRIVNQGTPHRTANVRKNGSTDNRAGTDIVSDAGTCFVIGVDSNRIFEINLEQGDDPDHNVYLIGYFGDEATFKTNADDVSPGAGDAADEWHDVDISSETGADTAIGAIVEVHSDTGGTEFAIRNNGSTDDWYDEPGDDIYIGYFMVGVDGSEIFEVIRDATDLGVYLVGYVTDTATFQTNVIDIKPTSASTWQTKSVHADATGVFAAGSGQNVQTYGVREPSRTSADDFHVANSKVTSLFAECNSSGEVASYITNTAANKKMGVFGYSEADTEATLTVQDATHSHAADGGTFTQVHDFTIAESSHAHATDASSFSQVHDFTIADALHSHAAENVTLGVDLTIADCSHAHAADGTSFSQVHSFAVNEATHAHAADAGSFSQIHDFSPAEALHAHTADNTTLPQNHDLTVAEALHAHAAESVTFTQVHSLSIAEALHSHGADVVSFSQVHSLAIAECLHAHAGDNATFDTSVFLAVADALHAHNTDVATFSQVHSYSPAGALHSHAADGSSFSQTHDVTIAEATHAHAADGTSFGQVHILDIDETLHAHSAAVPTFEQTHLLIIADATHALIGEQAELVTSFELDINGALHSHTAEQLTLGTGAALSIHPDYLLELAARARETARENRSLQTTVSRDRIVVRD